MYGSSRPGMWKRNVDVEAKPPAPTFSMPLLGSADTPIFMRGNKLFELTNHLGNMLSTISDKRYGISTDGSTVTYFNPDVVSANDYYPFGMLEPGRQYAQSDLGGYRYGFNGKEQDNEVKGVANQIDYGNRIYDPRVGRFLSTDPLQKQYVWLSPYQFGSNSPIANVDLDGLEAKYYTAEIFTYSGQHAAKLANTTATVVEEKGKEVAVAGLLHTGHGSLGKGALITIYQTDEIIKDGKPVISKSKVGDFYIPADDKDPQEKRGGLYLVSKSGQYGHADGELEGDDAIPIKIDPLVAAAGGFPDNESAIEAATEIFTSEKLSENALSVLETVKNVSEVANKYKEIKEALTALAEEMKAKNESKDAVSKPNDDPGIGKSSDGRVMDTIFIRTKSKQSGVVLIWDKKGTDTTVVTIENQKNNKTTTKQ
jgi:RHS repeat-associated protein